MGHQDIWDSVLQEMDDKRTEIFEDHNVSDQAKRVNSALEDLVNFIGTDPALTQRQWNLVKNAAEKLRACF